MNYSVGFRGPNTRDFISSFADYALENDLGGDHYSDPDLTLRDHVGKVEEYELERVRNMMHELINQPEEFKQWFGRFATTPRHELDIAPAEPPFEAHEIVDALMQGDSLTRLSGLRVLNVGGRFFVNSEALETENIAAADALCRYTLIGKKELGNALQDPEFIAVLTELVNQGYWFFDD